jgi:type IV pilus assembly protein PilA
VIYLKYRVVGGITMRMFKNKKGFTLVELLAVIVILAVILTIAVPNVMKIVEKTRKDAFESTAAMMISSAKTQAAAYNDYLPNSGECSVIKIDLLELENIDKDPDGGDYDLDNSYVAIANDDGTYKYYVTLIGSKRKVNLALEGNITSSLETDGIKAPSSLKRSDVGLSGTQTCVQVGN